MAPIGFGSGEGLGDDEMSWLRYSPVWKAGVEVLDEPWRGPARPRAMLLVMGEGNVVHEEVLDARRVRSPADAAEALGRAVHAVAARARGYPRVLLVPDWATAVRLESELGRHGVNVRVSPSLREVRHTIRHLAALLDVPDVAEELLPLDAWDEDGVDPRLARVLFPAATRFWRARPWERLPDEEPFLARWRGRDSMAVVTRPDGHGHTLTLFTHAPDYHEDAPFGIPEHSVLGLRFVERAAVPRVLRRQIAAEGWEVAGPGAHPLVMGAGPAFHDGLTSLEVQHLAAVLSAVAAWVETRRAAPSALPFLDPESGVELRSELDVDAVPWPAMRRARPACAKGPRALSPVAPATSPRERDEEARRVDAFYAHLRARGSGEALSRRYTAGAAEWARFLDGHARISAGAATEYDLRRFLYDWYPLHARGSEAEAERVPAALRRYFGWQGEHEGIAYPWADAVLRERDAYLERLQTAPLGRSDDGAEGSELVRWRRHLYRDLDARVLLRDRGFPDPALNAWERPRSPRTAGLTDELQRLWLHWRDEAVAAGTTAPGPLRAVLLARQREWERTAHPAFGASPLRLAAEDDAAVAG